MRVHGPTPARPTAVHPKKVRLEGRRPRPSNGFLFRVRVPGSKRVREIFRGEVFLTSRDAFVDPPVVSLASPWLRMVVGRGAELALAELRHDSSLGALPIEDVNTLNMLVAHGHEATREIAPAEPDRARADSRCIDTGARIVTTMTTTEVATVLNLSEGRVGQLARSGEIPSVVVGRHRQYRRTDVETYAANRPANRQEGHQHG
jgi:excisionase family DNA binding protein